MAFKNKIITTGFIIAGLMNMTVLIYSRLFSNPVIAEYDPVVMSNFGLLMIVIWGFAYIAVAKNYHTVKWLVGVFAVEKFIYGYIWLQWMKNNSVDEVAAKDKMASMFFSGYGLNDWVFFVFFLVVFIQLSVNKQETQ